MCFTWSNNDLRLDYTERADTRAVLDFRSFCAVLCTFMFCTEMGKFMARVVMSTTFIIIV